MKATRTNILLNDNLISEIMRLSDVKTKKEAVEKALQTHLNWLKRQKLASLRGKVEWDGDLMDMRTSKR